MTAGREAIIAEPLAPWNEQTIPDVLARMVAWNPDKRALAGPDGHLTYLELETRSKRLAAGLQSIGVHRDDPIAVAMPASNDWVVLFVACSRLGAPLVPINPRMKPSEVAYIVENAKAEFLVLDSMEEAGPGADVQARFRQICGPMQEHRPKCMVRNAEGTMLQSEALDLLALENESAIDSDSAAASPNDVGVIQYTSGTTGFPKGVMLTQDQMLRNAWCVGDRLAVSSQDRMYSPMPFYHVGGAVLSLLMMISRGGCLHFPASFDPSHMLHTLESEGCTVIAGIEAMFFKLHDLETPEFFRGLDVRAGWCAAPDFAYDLFPGLVNIYGLSENSPNACMSNVADPIEVRRDTCGRPQPGLEVGVFPVEGSCSSPLRLGEVGEIRVRGWSVMKGYINDPAATAQAITSDGWLRTGDLGTITEAGNLVFGGRASDTLRIGGERVAAAEIERVLSDHPAVSGAFVVGVPHPRYGEVPLAVVLSDSDDPTEVQELEQELIELVESRLARFKWPKHYRFSHELPLTESGKVQKRQLRERFLAETRRTAGAGATD